MLLTSLSQLHHHQNIHLPFIVFLMLIPQPHLKCMLLGYLLPPPKKTSFHRSPKIIEVRRDLKSGKTQQVDICDRNKQGGRAMHFIHHQKTSPVTIVGWVKLYNVQHREALYL